MRAAGRSALGAVLALLGLSALLVLPAAQASAASYHVLMKGYAFSPAALTITAGTTVTWTNEDTAPHDVKTTSGPVAIHSPMLSKGQSWSFTFTTAGSYGYVCTVHPDMTAQVAVKAVAEPTPAAPTTHEQQHQHTTVPNRTATARTPSHTSSSSPPPAMSMPASSPTPAAAAAAPASPTAAPQTGQLQQAASTSRPLDPLLVLAGLVAGVAVMCLLLVGSRAAQASGGETTN
ncbi:plastocyanin/azurin family copper-binding protein [Streptomyces sp. NPDC005538]|uniref:cupredoxin domain-containing protein n=1 Tax=unclassified Streptomyces TaxID=2593676 RepID=UPI0033A8A6D1